MSCGQIALTNLGCFPNKYYASEVDKFAIQQTSHVFPDTIHIGDVTQVDVSINENGIRPHRGDARKSGIGELGTIRFESSKADTLLTSSKPIILDGEWTLRRLTPVECARLQTVPDWYEWIVSDTQIYRMCGNGWTVRVIEHILKNLFV